MKDSAANKYVFTVIINCVFTMGQCIGAGIIKQEALEVKLAY